MMKIVMGNDCRELGKNAGEAAAACIRDAIGRNGKARIILSTGASQFETIEALTSCDLPWEKVEMFHLDEYIGMSDTHPASFRKYLKERVLARVPMGIYHLIDGEGDFKSNLSRISEALLSAPIDLALIGIGENGHIAFNDPPADFETKEPFLVVSLDEACRRQQLREGWFPTFADVPEKAITMSVHRIMQSRRILSAVPHAAKAAAVRATLGGTPSPTLPATILKTHPDMTLFLDLNSASLTDPRVLALF
jgi:glucosamine-6-phosphate deaminase